MIGKLFFVLPPVSSIIHTHTTRHKSSLVARLQASAVVVSWSSAGNVGSGQTKTSVRSDDTRK